MSFHVDFILTRVVTKGTVKGTIFTEHIGIEEVVKVLALSWKSSYENIHQEQSWIWMFLLHMHPVSTPTGTHIMAHLTFDLLVSIRHVFGLDMSVHIVSIFARVFTEATCKQTLPIEAEIGIEDIIQLRVGISRTCGMNRLDISPLGSFLKAPHSQRTLIAQQNFKVFQDVFC